MAIPTLAPDEIPGSGWPSILEVSRVEAKNGRQTRELYVEVGRILPQDCDDNVVGPRCQAGAGVCVPVGCRQEDPIQLVTSGSGVMSQRRTID